MTRLRLYLAAAAIAALIASHAAVYFWGNTKGFHAAQIECKDAEIEQLTSLISSTQALTESANTASLALGKTINDRTAADAKTTKELRRVLSETAHLRAGCVFDDDVMHQLDEAANKADGAATGGFNHRVPASGEAD